MEKRKCPRVKVQGGCSGRMILVDHLDIMDISESGIHLCCTRRILTNTVQKIHIAKEDVSVDLKGIVVRSQFKGTRDVNGKTLSLYEVAMTFENVPPAQQKNLRILLDYLEECTNS